MKIIGILANMKEKLSGGQRQRLAIARTFYKNPNLFIFAYLGSVYFFIVILAVIRN